MKKCLIIGFCLILTGCLSLPKYYENEQTIHFTPPANTTLTFPENKESILEENEQKIKLKRSFSDLKVLLSQEGFESKEITIKSHLTDDKWAEVGYIVYGKDTGSAFYLLPPVNTIGAPSATLMGSSIKVGISNQPLLIPLIPVAVVVSLIAGVGLDIYNLVYGIPSVIIANPWYEYDKEIDLSDEILTPTPEFEKQCHKKKKTFIGNHQCLTCEIKQSAIATESECNLCPAREMLGNHCALKECPPNHIKTTDGSCTPPSPFINIFKGETWVEFAPHMYIKQ